jgi:hypothetical protein
VDAEPHLEEVIHGNGRGRVDMEIMPHLRQEGVRKMGGGTDRGGRPWGGERRELRINTQGEIMHKQSKHRDESCTIREML